MKPSIEVDLSKFAKAMKKAGITAQDMQAFGFAGSAVVMATQKMLVPVDTGATWASIAAEPVSVTSTRAEYEIGPSTEYAPYIEYGVASKPNYPIQPFVVPSATGDSRNRCIKAVEAAVMAKLKMVM